MNYKYNIQTNEYPDIYMPGYGEISQPITPDDTMPGNNQNILPSQRQNNPTPSTSMPSLPSNIPPTITTPMPNDSQSVTNNEDRAYILFLYPKEARQIKNIVDTKLNTLDYEGSIIFHEYPDKEALMNIIDQIEIPFDIEEISPNWLRQLVEVIFINEMLNKRTQHNSNNNSTNNNN